MKNITTILITLPLLLLLSTCTSHNEIEIKWNFENKEKLLYTCKYTMINKSSSDDAPQVVFDGFVTVVPRSDSTSLLVFSHDAASKQLASRAIMNQDGNISSAERFNFLNYILFPVTKERLRENAIEDIEVSIPVEWFDDPTSISGNMTLQPENLQDQNVSLQSHFVFDEVAQVKNSKLAYKGLLKGNGIYTYDPNNGRYLTARINLEMASDESSNHIASPQNEEITTMHFSGASREATYEIVLDFISSSEQN